MAQVLVPGVAQAKLQGTISGHPWNAIWHYSLSTPNGAWTPGQLGGVCNSIMAGWGSFLKSFYAPGTILDSVSAVDIGQANPALGQSTSNPVPGTGTDSELAPQLTVNVRFLIAARYRGGHPRTALPAMGFSHASQTEDTWLTASVGAFQTAFENLQDGVFQSTPGIFQCVPRYTYTYIDDPQGHKWMAERTGLKAVNQVLNWVVNARIGTVRRRNR